MRPIEGFRLWLGHAGDGRNLRLMFASGVEAVCDLALNEPGLVLPWELVYCRFPLVDGAVNPPWLLDLAVKSVAELIRAQRTTLILCSAGLSRSPAVAAAAIAHV